MSQLGIIAIGRNEGDRLRRCLVSVVGRGWPVVYVDSASTDGSAAMAREMGADVVDLDMSIPFSAARARNEGFARLLQISPEVKYVMMVDGDCEIVAGWMERAATELDARPEAAVVCGRRRERFPEASVYNRIADIEWNTPIGEAKSCGGDALFRVAAFQQAGGYDNSVVAGEEPELCQRLREKGWKIFRIDAEMTIHDSAMSRFGQWWKRAVRSGYGAMDVATRFRRGKDGLFVKQVKSAERWSRFGTNSLVSVLWPILYVLLWWALTDSHNWASFWTYNAGPFGFFCGGCLGLLAVVLQMIRLSIRVRPRVTDWKTAIGYGALTMIGKWAHRSGQKQYLRDRKDGKLTRMIDYKSAGGSSAPVVAAT